MQPGRPSTPDREVTALVHPLDHLLAHRRMILVRSVAAGVAGMMPVPVLDDWASAAIRRAAVRQLAEARRVDLDDAALRAIADGPETPPGWRTILSSSTVLAVLRRTWRKALIVVVALRRAEEITRSFAALTLFDHYCARLHIGAGLDAREGRALRAAIDEAISRAQGDFLEHAVRRGLTSAARAAVRAPFEVADALSGGTLRRFLARGDETAAEEVVEQAVTRAATEPRGFLGRATRAIEDELGRVGSAYVWELLEAFERTAPVRRARGTEGER